MKRQQHRTSTGRDYKGLPVHAAGGVHQRAIQISNDLWAPGSTILDVGAGTGAFALALLDSGLVPIAMDLDTSSVPDSIETIQGDVCRGALSDVPQGSYDGIVALELIEHLDGPRLFLGEAYRLLKPNASLMLSTPNITHPYSRLKFLIKKRFWLFDENQYWATGHSTPIPDWLLEQMLLATGFVQIEMGLAGSFELTGLKKIALSIAGRLVNRSNYPIAVSQDGSTLIVLARKPETAV